MFHSYEMPAVGQRVRARSHGGKLGKVESINWPLILVCWDNRPFLEWCAPEYLEPAPQAVSN